MAVYLFCKTVLSGFTTEVSQSVCLVVLMGISLEVPPVISPRVSSTIPTRDVTYNPAGKYSGISPRALRKISHGFLTEIKHGIYPMIPSTTSSTNSSEYFTRSP